MPPPLTKRLPRPGPPKRSARQRVLAQWRGVDTTPLEIAQATPARAAGAVLPKLFQDLRLEGRRAEAEVVKVWNQLIDPAVVAHAQPVGLRKGTLFVVVDSSVWLSEIVRYRREEILERLQHSFGAALVKKISYRVG
jgi:predicted nucleic acid-binding Zn ribbon protein